MTQNSTPLLHPSTAILILALFVAGGVYVLMSRPTSPPAPDFPPAQAAAQITKLGFTNILILGQTDQGCSSPSVNYRFTAKMSSGTELSGVVCSGNGDNNLIVLID